MQAVAFAAANNPTAVATVYQTAILPYSNDLSSRRNVIRRIKEAIIKTTVIVSLPRAINAIRALIAALPDTDSEDRDLERRQMPSPYAETERGREYMRNIFRADLEPFLNVMDKHCPDMHDLILNSVYGLYQSDVRILGAIETSQINIASLVCMDVPNEVAWHMRGLVRNGGTEQQMDFALTVALNVCRIENVRLKNTMPIAKDVINQERLF